MTAIVDAGENAKSYLKPNSGGLNFERAGRLARLGERLVDEGLVSEQNLQLALQEQTRRGVRLEEALLELGLVDEARLLPLLAEQLGVETELVGG